MNKPVAQRLKVFLAQIGFYDTVVAAPSQAAALRAWGVRQNLFVNGDARTTQEAEAVAAALKYPEKPLRRAVGTHDSFELEPTSLPKIPDKPKNQPSKGQPKLKGKPLPVPDRTKLDAAEAALLDLIKRRKEEEADLKRQENALEAQRTAAQESFLQNRKKAMADVEAARLQYRKGGGIN